MNFKNLIMPTDVYDPAWKQFNDVNPRIYKSLGSAAVDDGATDDSAAADAAAEEAERLKAEAIETENDKNSTAEEIKAAKDAAEAAKNKALAALVKKEKEVKKLADDLKAVNEKLKDFEGLDAAEIKKLLNQKKVAEEAELAAKGEWDRLKERMASEHRQEVERMAQTVSDLQGQVGQKDSLINQLTIGHAFNSSKFIGEELILSPGKARTLYGDYFDITDGVVVAYDKPRGATDRTPYVDGQGRSIGFDEALKKIIETDPDKDTLIRSKLKSGASSDTKTNLRPPADKEELRGLSKIAAGLKKGIGKK